MSQINVWTSDYLGGDVIDTEAAEEATAPILRAVQEWGDNVLGIVSSGLGSCSTCSRS